MLKWNAIIFANFKDSTNNFLFVFLLPYLYTFFMDCLEMMENQNWKFLFLFQLYMYKNIFNIPSHVLLPEDEVQTVVRTQSEEESLDDEITILEMKIWAVCKIAFCLLIFCFLLFPLVFVYRGKYWFVFMILIVMHIKSICAFVCFFLSETINMYQRQFPFSYFLFTKEV